MMPPSHWILASASPRRQELLKRIVPAFEVHGAHVDEWEPDTADPVAVVEENARRKGRFISRQYPEAAVIAADTTVALGRRIFNKPANLGEAAAMLRALSGRTHHVYTGLALCRDGKEHIFHEQSMVIFKTLNEADIAAYLAKVPVLDKAGGYAIQDHGDLIIERFEGTFENIMGLPVQRLARECVQLGWMSHESDKHA